MKTILLVVTIWSIVLLAELAMAQCWTETTFTADGRTIFCQVCKYGEQIIRTCY